MKYAKAVQAILQMNNDEVYEHCRYSLIHKVIQDVTHSSTPSWRYGHPEFYWSLNAITEIVKFIGGTTMELLPDKFELHMSDSVAFRKILHKEHIVPTGIVISYLLSKDECNLDQIAMALGCASTVCIVTYNENRRLHKAQMPPEYLDFFADKWSRYRYPKHGEPIRISRYSCKRSGKIIKFCCRSPNDMANVP